MYKPTGTVKKIEKYFIMTNISMYIGTNVTPLGAKRRFNDGSTERRGHEEDRGRDRERDRGYSNDRRSHHDDRDRGYSNDRRGHEEDRGYPGCK